MKLKFILPLFFAALSFTACNSDDDNAPQNTLTGVWKLKNVAARGNNLNYTEGQATWTINSDGTIDVVNNIWTMGPEQIYSQLSTGSYDYETVTTGSTTVMTIDDIAPSTVTFNGTDLILSSTETNGTIRTFNR